MTANEIFLAGTLGSFLAGCGTVLGAAGVLVVRRLDPLLEDVLLGAAAGVMLAACVFSLLLPGIALAERQFGSTELAVLVVGTGLLAGAGLIWFIHNHVPHEHFILGPEGPRTERVQQTWLFVFAITLHNFPEGMAVGVSFADGIANGTAMAVGIGLQNIPEGLAVAVSMRAVGYGRLAAVGIGALTGVVEPLGGMIGAGAAGFSTTLLPLLLAGSAGAMLFIINHEIIPETHRRGFRTSATFALLLGFVVMMYLDATLG